MVTPSIESTDELLLGAIVDGRYRIVERVGAGGMSALYRALQTGAVGREVAFKVLHNKTLKNQLALRRFENEAQIIAQLRHPHTLKLVDSGRLRDGRMYLVTEFLVGESLDRRLLRGRLSPRRTLRLMDEICESLAEAHRLGIVHRDLKPANVFIEKVGDQEIVRVLDFGIAKLVNRPGLTLPMQVFGTPGYMSPEQARGEEVNGRADLYSLGVIAFECLSGRLPIAGHTPLELIENQAHAAAIDLGALIPRELIGAEVVELVMALLESRASDRPSSAAEVRARIAALERGARTAAPEVTPEASRQAPARWTETTTDREVGFDDTAAARESSERTIAEHEHTDPVEQTINEKTTSLEQDAGAVDEEKTLSIESQSESDSGVSAAPIGSDPTPRIEREASLVVRPDPALQAAAAPHLRHHSRERRRQELVRLRLLIGMGLLLVLLVGALIGVLITPRPGPLEPKAVPASNR